MANSEYRQAMLKAFAFPVLLFVVFPFSVALLSAPPSLVNLLNGLGLLAAILGPLYVTGLLLAPWAGRHVASNKVPAFVMAAAAALASAAMVFILGAVADGLALSLSFSVFFAFFALPASPLAALFFIGACERMSSGKLTESRQT